jgi:hypothetical protein
MKRIEFLIKDIKSMSNIGGGSYSDDLLVMYFNEAQSEIRNIIYNANNDANILKDRYNLDIVRGQREYDLPKRIYAVNSILTARASYLGGGSFQDFTPLKYLSYREFGREFGYTLLNNKFLLSINDSSSSTSTVEIVYNTLLPKLAKRSGKVASITGSNISLDEGADPDMYLKTDFLTFVDQDGNIVKSDVRLVEQVGTDLTVDSVTDITVGSYVLIGEYATTNSRLPLECEDFLRKYVERRVAIGDSAAKDMESTSLLTETEKAEITALFEKSSDDVLYPVISPETPWM